MRGVFNLCLLSLALGVVGCSSKPPKHPVGVPAEAVFVGKRKVGHFVHMQGPKGLGWQLCIYDAQTGKVVAQGAFELQGLARAEILPGELVSFDGKELLLKDGSRLVPAR